MSPRRVAIRRGELLAFGHVAVFVANLVLVAIALSAALRPPRTMKIFTESPTDIAAATTRKLVYEAYPTWLAEAPDRICPTSLEPLLAWTNLKTNQDPWGRPYQFTCAATIPRAPGLHTTPPPSRLVVWSVGPDGEGGTEDDLWSNR